MSDYTDGDLLAIVRAGGSVIVGAGETSLMNLMALASAAAEHGGTVTIRDAAKMRQLDRFGLAQGGKSHVVFDFTA